MSDSENGNKPRPIGRKGDLISRLEVDARIAAVDGRTAHFAAELRATTARLTDSLEQEARYSIDRDAELEREIRKLALLFGQRIRALEAKTFAGRLQRLRAWWTAKTEPTNLETRVSAPAVVVEPTAVRRIRWTGDPSCLPEFLRPGYHEGMVTRIDKAVPVRTAAGEVLCHVGDEILIGVDGELSVAPAR